jgi:hypothetical protein
MKHFQWKIVFPMTVNLKENPFDQIPEEYKIYMEGSGREAYEFFIHSVNGETNEEIFCPISPLFLQRIPSFLKYQQRMRRSYSDDICLSEIPFDYHKVYKMLEFLVHLGGNWFILYSF